MKKEYIVELTEAEADGIMDEHWIGELVRCKDCKFYESLGEYCQYDGTVESNRRHPHGIACKPDWFCADGERSE